MNFIKGICLMILALGIQSAQAAEVTERPQPVAPANEDAKDIITLLSHPEIVQTIGSSRILSVKQDVRFARHYQIAYDSCVLSANVVTTCAPCMPGRQCSCATEVKFDSATNVTCQP